MLGLGAFFGLMACQLVSNEPFVLDTDIQTGTQWGDTVALLSSNDSHSGDLSRGSLIALDFAHESTLACWPATEDANFAGPHQFFALDMPTYSTLVVSLDSQPGVDANLYVIQMGTTNTAMPPTITTATTCEAAYPASSNSNAGGVDTATVDTYNNPYNVLIGVAGAQGHDSGGFTLSVTTTATP